MQHYAVIHRHVGVYSLEFSVFSMVLRIQPKKNTEMFYAFCVAVMSIIAIGSKTIILTQIFFYDV